MNNKAKQQSNIVYFVYNYTTKGLIELIYEIFNILTMKNTTTLSGLLNTWLNFSWLCMDLMTSKIIPVLWVAVSIKVKPFTIWHGYNCKTSPSCTIKRGFKKLDEARNF